MSARTARWDRVFVLLASVPLIWGFWSFGMWDPWELGVADAARALGTANAAPGPAMLQPWVIAQAFQAFGPVPWVGRLPGIIAAATGCWLLFVWMRRDVGSRAGITALVILATSPLFLLNARLMMGDAISMAAQLWVGMAAFRLCTSTSRPVRRLMTCTSLIAAMITSTWATGVLLGPLPPLLAVAGWGVLVGDTSVRSLWPASRWGLVIASTVAVIGVARAIMRDGTEFDWWIGGGVVGGDPPTYDAAFEVLFHGLAPWSAVLPVAVLWMVAPRPTRSPKAHDLAWLWVLWAIVGYAAWTIYASRYGRPPMLAAAPLSGIVALWLTEVVETPRARWGFAVAITLLFGLLIRDYALYPQSALRGLSAEGLMVPTQARTTGAWAAALGASWLAIALVLIAKPEPSRPSTRRILERVRDLWREDIGRRVWLSLAAVLALTMLGFGAACFAADLRLPSVVIRVGRALFFLPFAIAGFVVALPWLSFVASRMGEFRLWLTWLGGLGVAAFVSMSFQPTMSAHLSPKSVYDAYEELADASGQPLASYRTSSGTGRYYTATAITEIDKRSELLTFLETGGQRWVLLPEEELALVNREYRNKTGRHLFVANADNARILLVAAQPVADLPNENTIAAQVRDERPAIPHAIEANFADRISLLGYSLDLPDGATVGAGQRFEITWYWEATGSPPRGYEVFVHVDGYGRRINGDHVPIEGSYPFKYWMEGDVVVDPQTLRVPANFPSGDYPIYVGLFKGETRLEVTTGDHDGSNRVHAGNLRVR
ncbi:MAG: glycosyltransferase family 39 protein [Polyangiales bacterium]